MRRAVTAALLLLTLHAEPAHAQSQNLPLEHWAYEFLDRLETRGLFVSEELSTRPHPRAAIAENILQVHEKVTVNPSLLSGVEWGLFERLKGEFYEELEKLKPDFPIREEEYEPHLFTFRNEVGDVRADGLLGHRRKFTRGAEVDPEIPTAVTSVGLILRVDIRESLAIYAQERSFFISVPDSLDSNVYDPDIGVPVTVEGGGVAVTDRAVGYAVLRLPWLDIEAGRDLVAWGPGYRSNLILSRDSDVYDLFKFTFRFKKFKYETFHGFLNADETKYLSGKRFEARIFPWLQFGIAEAVVYGNRSIEFMYINPFIPINLAERHLGDRDNNTISFDFTYFSPFGIKAYGELFLDDFSVSKNLFNDYGNKWAVLLGALWVDPLGLPNTEFRVEAVRIQPFVYTHRDPINTYKNYNNPLGHWLGPDADDWFLEITHRPHRNLKLGLSWEQRRRGDNNINEGTPPEDRRIHFLDGVVERNRFHSLFAEWQPVRDLFVHFRYDFIQTDNLRRDPNRDPTTHRFRVQLDLNY